MFSSQGFVSLPLCFFPPPPPPPPLRLRSRADIMGLARISNAAVPVYISQRLGNSSSLYVSSRLRRARQTHSSFMAAGPSSSSDTSVPSFLSAPRNLIIAGPHSHDLSLHAVQKTNRSDLRRGAREAERDKGMGTVVGGPDADLSKMGERDGGEGKAYYPSSSALNYLNANDVRGESEEGRRGEERIGEERRKMMMGRKTLRGNGKESTSVLAGEDKMQQRGANLLLLWARLLCFMYASSGENSCVGAASSVSLEGEGELISVGEVEQNAKRSASELRANPIHSLCSSSYALSKHKATVAPCHR
ncbi:hypothetical protein F7725_015322 [Dissostichus mawsoni]|uniref:Uncharacterized protein n=1 Tax=Dissostichus mawsoni TaxID=36200 RepID=A0A7J5YHA2_DISMA|nr:hypothetical protein F7725_015322 [Dissostichus mawsoni]